MKNLFLIAVLLLCGCSTVDYQKELNEDNARKAADWVKERSGFIESAVMSITHIAVYSTEKDTEERTEILNTLHIVSSNLNSLVENKIVEPDSIRAALKIKEPYIGAIMSAVFSLIQVESGHFKENGYGNLSIEILRAVSKGVADGSVL